MKTLLLFLFVALSFSSSAQTTKDSVEILLVNNWVADSIGVGDEIKYPPENAFKSGFEFHADKSAKSFETAETILDATWSYDPESKFINLYFIDGGDLLKLKIDHISKKLLIVTVTDDDDASGASNFRIFLTSVTSLR